MLATGVDRGITGPGKPMATAREHHRTSTWRACGPAALAFSLLAAALAFNQSAVHWRGNINDSHYYAYCGWRVSQGARPYLDVWNNKPPGTWWVNAVGYWLCGPGRGRELLICSAAVALAVVGLVAVARTVYHRSLWPVALVVGCALLTHLRYECGGNRTETFVVPCEILAVWGYLRWRRCGELGWLVLGGLLAGAAPLFKQSGLAALGACALHLLWSQLVGRREAAGLAERWWVPWVVGGAAVTALPAVSAVVLTAQGALGEAYFAIWRFNRAYFQANDATWIRLRDAFAPYWPELKPLFGLYLLAGLGVFLAAWRRRPRTQPAEALEGEGEPGVGVLWLWLLAGLYLACVGPGRLAYHLAPTLAPLGLLALYPLNWLIAGRSLGRRIVARPSIAAAVVVYLYVLAIVGADSVTIARRCWLQKPHWYALRREPPAPYEVQAAEIVRRTRPDDTIYVWGWSPGTYRFAYRHSPARFSTLEKLSHVGEQAAFIREEAIVDIQRAPPTAFVISVGDLEAMMASPRSAFARWIAEHYRDLGNFEGMHILLWRR